MYRAVIDFEINEVILSSDVAHDLGDMRDFTFLINRIEGVLAIESDFEYASLVGKKRRGPKPEPQIEKRYDNTVDGYCIPMPQSLSCFFREWIPGYTDKSAYSVPGQMASCENAILFDLSAAELIIE